jgi:hypothetical protein
MPAYITEPTISQGPVSGQQNQALTTIPSITPSTPFYSLGRLAGYSDAPTQNSEIGEALAVQKGRQCSLRAFAGLNQNSPAIFWEYLTTGTPATISVQLEGAPIDLDSEYKIIGAALTVVGGGNATVNLGSERFNFLRINVTIATGGASPTIAAKIVM